MRTALLLCCSLAGLTLPVMANPVRLTLVLEHAQTLPGIPVTFRVTAINTGTAAALLPSHVRLEMTTEAGSMSIVFPGARGEEDLVEFPSLGSIPAIELGPGEQKKLDFFAAPGSPPWFCDERLQRPGSYRLRLRADRELSGNGWTPSADPIVSNEVVLTVSAPAGVDAEAWRLISGGNVCLGWDAHAATLWNQYPDSIYTSMTIRPYPKRDRTAEMASLEATLAKHPPAGFADSLKDSIAHAHVALMERAVLDGDVQKAFEHSEMARAIFQELATKDTETTLKMEARQSLRVDVMTLAELQDYEARVRRVAPPKPKCETAQVAAVRGEIAQMAADSATTAKTSAKLQRVVEHLDRYATEAGKRPPAMSAALHELRAAVDELETMRSSIPSDVGRRWMSGLVNAAAMSARKAVAVAATDTAARTNMLTQAQRSLTDAEAAATQDDYRTAARLFKAAVDRAEAASNARATYC